MTLVLGGPLVPPEGSLSSKIVLIGEAPGVEEESLKRPFVGSSGKLLTSMLTNAGISRDECYITNVCKHRLPKNDFSLLYEDKKKTTPSPMLRQLSLELRDELRQLRPNVIVPLGGEALRALTDKRSIDAWRGSVISSPLGKVLPTYHPARILRVYSEISIFHHDLCRVREESEFPEIKSLGLELELQPSYSRVVEFLTDLLRNPRVIAFDIETTENHVRCLGIADSPTHAICIPFMSNSRSLLNGKTSTLYLGTSSSSVLNSHWEEEEEYSILSLLDRVFSSRAIEKVAQNAPFDTQILGREFGFQCKNLRMDTMAAHHTLYPELPKGLDFLGSLYTRIPYWSDYEPSSDLSLWEYNCKDCVVTYQVWQVLDRELISRTTGTFTSSHNSFDFHSNHIEPSIIATTRISQRGILIDTKVQNELRGSYEKERDERLVRFQSLVGEVNPASPKQLSELFYSKLHLPPQLNPKTKNVTTDEDAIDTLSKKFPQHERIFTSLIEWRKYDKLISTYLEIPLLNGRAYTTLNPVGTVTGRCSSSRTIWGYGGNLQNIPIRSELGRPLRRMFISDPGKVLIKCDLSQAEFRLVVWFARIERLISRYLLDPNYDCHRWVASLIYRVEESDVTKDQRSVAKNGVYGGNYAMQAKRASVVYELPIDVATWVLSEYRKAIPEVPLWWKEVEAELNRTRIITNPFGRKRVFMDRLDDSTYRDAYSHTCQSTVADIIHRAETLGEIVLPQYSCETLLQIHDELLFQVDVSRLNAVLPVIKNIMEYPLTIPGVSEPLVIPADISYGYSWGETTKWKGERVTILERN